MILHALVIQIRAELRVRLSLNTASSRLTPLASGKLARVFFCDDVRRACQSVCETEEGASVCAMSGVRSARE